MLLHLTTAGRHGPLGQHPMAAQVAQFRRVANPLRYVARLIGGPFLGGWVLVSALVSQHGQSRRLGGAISGHHGLVRLHLKAWGCPPHS